MYTLIRSLATGMSAWQEGHYMRYGGDDLPQIYIGMPGPFWKIIIIPSSCFPSLSGCPRGGVGDDFNV